jgi:ubiquinone/menaquinone biosynthesis C-methylase UbiE
MENNHYKRVISYFSKKAAQYDLVDKQLYWSLSDQLLKKIIDKKIVDNFLNSKELRIMDAGAGTGRWSLVLYDLFKKKKRQVQLDLVDITQPMLKEAEDKIRKRGLNKQIRTYVGNIEDLSGYKNNFYDIIISFYNVLSFAENPKKILREAYKKLKNNGLYACIVSNKYHSYFFNIITAKGSGLKEISDSSKVRFNKNMPSIHCFTPAGIRSLFEEVGLKNIEVMGFPNFIYPDIEETYLVGQSCRHQNILKNKKIFSQILRTEYKECFNSDSSARGNTLLVIGRK